MTYFTPFAVAQQQLGEAAKNLGVVEATHEPLRRLILPEESRQPRLPYQDKHAQPMSS